MIYLKLDCDEFPEDLYWISTQGIYRPRNNYQPKYNTDISRADCIADTDILHFKYQRLARCFACVGDANDTTTWKLPYKNADGSIDKKRITEAIQCITANYRGSIVKGIPEQAISDVISRLYRAAEITGKLPHQNPKTNQTYQDLEKIYRQFK